MPCLWRVERETQGGKPFCHVVVPLKKTQYGAAADPFFVCFVLCLQADSFLPFVVGVACLSCSWSLVRRVALSFLYVPTVRQSILCFLTLPLEQVGGAV